MLENAESALQRAATVFCKQQPDTHIMAARYDERHGRIEAAREKLQHVIQQLAPRLLSAVDAAANFERRQVRNPCFDTRTRLHAAYLHMLGCHAVILIDVKPTLCRYCLWK